MSVNWIREISNILFVIVNCCHLYGLNHKCQCNLFWLRPLNEPMEMEMRLHFKYNRTFNLWLFTPSNLNSFNIILQLLQFFSIINNANSTMLNQHTSRQFSSINSTFSQPYNKWKNLSQKYSTQKIRFLCVSKESKMENNAYVNNNQKDAKHE